MKITVESLDRVPVEKQRVEIVERKGVGHPDSVADGLAETVSRALCKEYLQHFGYILHHNTDECQIVGGQSQPSFGGGVIIEPAYILLVGRATALFGNKRLPIRAIAVRAAHEYLEKNFRNLSADTDVIIDCKIWEGSQDLKSVYDPRRRLANDTSVGVGYAPLSETEKLTLQMERYININLRSNYPEIGEDVKVMSSRVENKINITVAIAMVDKHIPDADHYISVKEEIAGELLDFAKKFTEKDVSLAINTADDYEKGVFYLTVTGLSMENGDDGSVGRGNRINGLITPNRPASMEAAAGKNPVTHVGKLYNITATRIAQDIVKNYDVEEVYVKMLSQIGKPVTDPLVVGISVVGGNIDSGVEEIVKQRLEKIAEIKDEILAGKITVF